MKAKLTFKVLPGVPLQAMVDEIAERYAVDADVYASFHADTEPDADALVRLVQEAGIGMEIESIQGELPRGIRDGDREHPRLAVIQDIALGPVSLAWAKASAALEATDG